MRLFTFLVLEILLSPITLTGYLVWTLWSVAISQQQSLSITALSPLFFRWLLHLQGIRPDPAAAELMKTLPSLNEHVNWAVVGPTLWAMNISGYTPSVFNIPSPGTENLGNMINTRTLFFDKAIARSLETVEQVVILGAGFDTRLIKFCTNTDSDTFPALFEVDQRPMQRVKQQALERGLPKLQPIDRAIYRQIRFVPVDFNQENWIEKLTAAGFQSGKKTFFLWEGVTYYLTEKIVVESIQAMDAVCGRGSAIAFDFFPKHFLQGQDFWWMPAAMNVLDWIGEPFRFGPDTAIGNEAAIAQLLTGTGFKLSKLQMMGTYGHSAGFCGLALVTKSGS
ncbi:MAG: SAM-dependent methyltransferase [Cyanobacteria bacterium J06650_10]